MRIVFVSYEFPPQFGGGIGTYVAAIAPILAARGHHVKVVTITRARYPQRERAGGVDVIRLPLAASGGAEPMATLRAWQARSDAVADLLTRMWRAGEVDLVEFGDYRGEAATFLAATTPADRPVSLVKLHTPLSVLNKYNASQRRYLVLESFEDQAMLQADHLVSPSAALVREVRSHLPSMPHVDLLPYAADPSFLGVPPAPEREREEILYVGRLEERKGVETLVAAAPAVLDQCPGAVLHMVGGDTEVGGRSPSMKSLLIEALPKRYRDRVVFHGAIPREKLIEHYQRARVCVFPSLFENFPNTCLESMSLGRPVIGTDNSGMAEMIEDGISGRIVRAGDAEHLAATLVEVYAQPAPARAAMGQAARARIAELYHPDRIAGQFEQLYGGYIESHPARRTLPVRTGAHRTPSVAFVIPCYNHGRFIRETIASVQAQTVPGVQIVVVDDGSTDAKTIEVMGLLDREGIRVIRQDNAGLATARNTGVRATDAEFYVPLDADDRVAPEFVEKLLPALRDDPGLGYSYSHVQFFGAAAGVWQCPAYDPRKLLVENLSVATAVVRRSAFELVGGYNPDMVYGFEDWDFWLALLSAGYHGRCLPEPLFEYRKHPRGESMLDRTQQHRAEMVHRMVEHHRTLFASMLEVSLTDKDAMFFHAHMEAAHLREAAGRGAAGPESTSIYQALQAQAELDYIENSRTWRIVQRIRRNPVYARLATLRFGADWDQPCPDESPAQRLARIKASRFYRAIRAAKRTPVYRWYARRKYGAEFLPFESPERP